VFVYPETIDHIINFAKKHQDWIFFVCGEYPVSGENIIQLPFVSLRTYTELL
jgi:hypothetical protein